MKRKYIILFIIIIVLFFGYAYTDKQKKQKIKQETLLRIKEISITIPEGFSIREIDKRLAEKNLIQEGQFSVDAKGLEGYLFPDTYLVYQYRFDSKNLVQKMQKNFAKKITPELSAQAQKQKRTFKEIITMASMLEKEIKTEKDYSVVAGILWKRLDAGWPLQADATLLYGKSSSILTEKEISENNPYNTRKFKGLPPTPIGNPGLKTIRAALFPAASPYWFYLTDKEGNVHYAITNEEHNRNKRKYLL